MSDPKTPQKPLRESIETEVYELDFDRTPYPFCVIPPHFFDRAKAIGGSERKTLFSVNTWEGRTVFSVERSAHDDFDPPELQ
ncbi:MAG: hypothetical protein KDD64_01360 [Bdellovibrionales bacterium]|nr:hypothetical protein [Bdellovibrionales bacterium]